MHRSALRRRLYLHHQRAVCDLIMHVLPTAFLRCPQCELADIMELNARLSAAEWHVNETSARPGQVTAPRSDGAGPRGALWKRLMGMHVGLFWALFGASSAASHRQVRSKRGRALVWLLVWMLKLCHHNRGGWRRRDPGGGVGTRKPRPCVSCARARSGVRVRP